MNEGLVGLQLRLFSVILLRQGYNTKTALDEEKWGMWRESPIRSYLFETDL